jgi:2-polyprenyl-3-methyl-5-hydroxy-6-metoxy-1,4-benzoquinol methylase
MTNNNTTLYGPLTRNSTISLIERIAIREIILAYRDQYGIDTLEYFGDLEFIELYRETISGYCFYYPFGIEGDSRFYEELQKFDWYYMKWKWEHENCLKYLKKGNYLLEIGSANGYFIEKLSSSGYKCCGLELNSDAIERCQKKGLSVFKESIQEHAKHNIAIYDFVCSFQVMEHIANIKEVIEASIKVLKPGGILVVSVPNNDSFLGLGRNYLNMPPHHMGLWNRESLLYLPELFPIDIIRCDLEPLQEYHKQYFFETIKAHILKKSGRFNHLLLILFIKTFPFSLFVFSKKLKAFTIQVAYRKR